MAHGATGHNLHNKRLARTGPGVATKNDEYKLDVKLLLTNMRLWGWWRDGKSPDNKGEETGSTLEGTPISANQNGLLEDRAPKFQDDVVSAASAREAAKPNVVDMLQKIGADDFRNINSIPCFRHAILTGAGIGGVTGTIIFVAKRQSSRALNWAVGGFLMGAIISWEQCRFRMRQGKRDMTFARQKYKQNSGSPASPAPPGSVSGSPEPAK